MTVVNFQFTRRKVDVLADTLVCRAARPHSWAAKALMLPAQWMVVVARGPSNYRHDLGWSLEHRHLPNGIDDAVGEIPDICRATHDALVERVRGDANGQVWALGWSKERHGFAGWRFIGPEFDAEELPEGMHAAPGPVDVPKELYFRPDIATRDQMIELAKLQKRLVSEGNNGHESIGGDLLHIGMSVADGLTVKKLMRFDDFDDLAAQMVA